MKGLHEILNKETIHLNDANKKHGRKKGPRKQTY
jgi:hypothetical protein